MIRNRNIVIVGLQPWDIKIGSNCKNIAMELSRNNRVLYVNPPLDRSTYMKSSSDDLVRHRIDVVKGRKVALKEVGTNLWNLTPSHIAESINWINHPSLFQWFNRINNRRLATDIQTAISTLGFDDFILFNDQSMIRCYYLKEMLQPELFVYYIRDNLSTIPYFKRHALDMEHQLIAQADVVATNSEFLAEYARKYNPGATFVGQGCDFSLYADPEQIKVADEMIPFARPVIGYTGFLTAVRLDIELLEHVAQQQPEWQIVLVGPEDEAFKASKLHDFKNVHFLGNKTPDSLPSYIMSFDVTINPQLINEVTMGNYPRKIDEYLAMGKPVVATYTPFMEYFKEFTYLAKNKQEFTLQIAKALREDTEQLAKTRRTFAFTHTWEANVEAISKLIEQKLKSVVETGI